MEKTEGWMKKNERWMDWMDGENRRMEKGKGWRRWMETMTGVEKKMMDGWRRRKNGWRKVGGEGEG